VVRTSESKHELTAPVRTAVEAVAFFIHSGSTSVTRKNLAYDPRLFGRKELDIWGRVRSAAGLFLALIRMLEEPDFLLMSGQFNHCAGGVARGPLRAWSDDPSPLQEIMVRLDLDDFSSAKAHRNLRG